jgi:hypothetical protein
LLNLPSINEIIYHKLLRDFSEISGEVNRELNEAIGQLEKHQNVAEEKWMPPEKGYAIVAYITPEMFK